MKKIFVIFVYISFIFEISLAEPAPPADGASLSGYILERSSEEPMVGASVIIPGTNYGAVTNKSGFYAVTNLPPGKKTVVVKYIGYESLVDTLNFKKNQKIRRDFKITEGAVTTEEVSVEADRAEDESQITVSRVDIPMPQLKNIRIGGEADIFRSLQYMPGILTSSQISSGLFIRGGSPDQNLVLLDGSTVYNPTHLFGFISTFNSEAIKDVELIKGGFPAEYGGRLSAVLNITQKEGNRKKVEGVGSVGVISSKASVEGPLGNGSWFIGGRRTYLELIKAFIPENPEEPIPDFNFYDANAKVTQNLGKNTKFYMSGFISADNLSYDGFGIAANLNLGNKAASARLTHIFGDDLFMNMNFTASQYDNDLNGDQSGYKFIFDNSITDYTLKGSLEWFTSERITHKFGFEVSKFDFAYLANFTGEETIDDTSESFGAVDLTVEDWNYAAYAQVNYRPFELTSFQAGLRSSYWQLRDRVLMAPRLAVRRQLQEDIAIKAAWGIYYQNLRLATQPDFSFFDTWLPTDSTLPSSKAIHYILSLETKPFEGYELDFDVYYKRMFNLNEINRFQYEQSNTTADVFFTGDGWSYGAEVFLSKKIGKFTGWAGYALGFITNKFDEINDGEEFRPKYDRRHDFKIVGQYKLNDHWEFGGTFVFQSGQSYTGATSRFQIRLPEQNYGQGVMVPSQRYGLRLPPSHQLNLNGSYMFEIFDLPARLTLDIFNVYNRRDIWFRYYDTRSDGTAVKDVRLLPILPTLSFEIRFAENR